MNLTTSEAFVRHSVPYRHSFWVLSVRAGEGGGKAEGRDEDQGDNPPGREDHGDGLELPEIRENGEKSHYEIWAEKGMACAVKKSSEIDIRTDK